MSISRDMFYGTVETLKQTADDIIDNDLVLLKTWARQGIL